MFAISERHDSLNRKSQESTTKLRLINYSDSDKYKINAKNKMFLYSNTARVEPKKKKDSHHLKLLQIKEIPMKLTKHAQNLYAAKYEMLMKVSK